MLQRGGDYHILSFINDNGNSDIKNVIGYGDFRIVTFNGDDKTYLFDVRPNTPRQISDKLPTTDNIFLLGYTNKAIYIINPKNKGGSVTPIYEITYETGEIEKKLEIPAGSYNSYDRAYPYSYNVYNNRPCYNFYIVIPSERSNYHGNGLSYYDTKNNSLITCVESDFGGAYYMYYYLDIINNLVYAFEQYTSGSQGNSAMYNINTKNWIEYLFKNSLYICGITLDSNYAVVLDWSSPKKLWICDYQYDSETNNISLLKNKEITNIPYESYKGSDGYKKYPNIILEWVTNELVVINKVLYSFDEKNLTFTEIVENITYPQIASTAKDVIIGYTYLGKNYYFTNGNSTINDKNILDGYYVRDQYNQKVRGTMKELGDIIITPTTETQTKEEGHIKSLIVNPVTSSIDTNIKAENIKEGVSILGVTGIMKQNKLTEEEYNSCMSIADDILGVEETMDDTTTN